MYEKDLDRVAEANDAYKGDDAPLQLAKSATIQSQYQKYEDRRQQRRNQHHRSLAQPMRQQRWAKQQIKPERCAQKLRKVGSDSRNLGSHPAEQVQCR